MKEAAMAEKKTTFALFFGNRGFFPASLIAGAREEMARQLKSWGHGVLMLDAKATRHGAVETPREGEVYAEFLRRNRGKFGGVILCLPNFGDETGAVAALQEAGVPILVQAYPDDLDKMAPALRRDAFCGKLSVMDVFCQYKVKFTALKPHTVAPSDSRFAANVDHFDRVCRAVNGVRGMVLGAVGARTTPFKTVRFDELALQRHGITVETFDLSGVMDRMAKLSPRDKALRSKAKQLKDLTDWRGVPARSFDNLARLGAVLDAMIEEYRFDALTLRCWTEMQSVLGISPCVLMGLLNEAGRTPCACEVDVGNAVAMHALGCASGQPVACLDWNNNYADDDDKCILFHCGPVPSSMMTDRGRIGDHAILANAVGKGKGFGCREGRIAPADFTFGSLVTDSGRLKFYVGEGRFTDDEVPEDFFGCAGVAEIEKLQDVLLHVGREGHRHHVSVTTARVMAPLREALGYYLGFDVTAPQVG
jgi:L-fucose isomerase-like protein